MKGLVRKAMLFVGGGVLIASAAMASVPSPANSTLPCNIVLVATAGGVLPPYLPAAPTSDYRRFTGFTLTVRDLANNPIGGASVVIKFVNCKLTGAPPPPAPAAERREIRISGVQPGPGVTAVCVDSTIRAITDAAGSITIQVVGSAGRLNPAASVYPGQTTGCAAVFADGVALGNVPVASFDLNASNTAASSNGVGGADASICGNDALGSSAVKRSDINCSGSVTGADTSLITGAVLSLTQGSGSSLCY